MGSGVITTSGDLGGDSYSYCIEEIKSPGRYFEKPAGAGVKFYDFVITNRVP